MKIGSRLLASAALVALVAMTGFFVYQKVAEAGANHNIVGWAWSSNVGWISFNSENCDADNDGQSNGEPAGCAPAGTPLGDYGVSKDAQGLLSGYAWSNNVGWISFNTGDLTGCPSGTCEARVTNGMLVGWAKALNGNPASGWDGWMRLSGTATNGSPYGVTFSGGVFGDFSWGDDVIGWVDWDPANGDGGVRERDPGPSVTCTVSDAVGGRGDIITWTAEATGGSGGYTYLWGGTPPLAGLTGPIVELSYNTYGEKTGFVTVTDSNGAQATSLPCVNPDGDGGPGDPPGGDPPPGGTGIDILPRLTTGVVPPVPGGPVPVGPGTVVDPDNDVDCSLSSCENLVAPNATVHLTFIPSGPTTVFIGWVGPDGSPATICDEGPDELECTFPMTDDYVVRAQTRLTECADGISNDGDGPADMADPDCNDPTDDTEGGVPACSDNEDNDGDGFADHDGVDLNNDGDFDDAGEFEVDPGCSGPNDNDETDGGPVGPICPADGPAGGCPKCNDGVDNDVPPDGFTDYPSDPGCRSLTDDDETNFNPDRGEF